MRTRFDADSVAFSERAHIAAQRAIYPQLFGVSYEDLGFQKCDVANGGIGGILDGELGIDRVVSVAAFNFRAPFEFTIQERFRKPNHGHYSDLTITEYNNASGKLSELYKIKAQYFLYGYFDESTGRFTDAVVVTAPDMIRLLQRGELKYSKRSNPKGQDFIGITFEQLDAAKIVRYWHKRDKKKGRRIHDLKEFEELWPKVLMRIRKKIGISAVAYLHDAVPAELNPTESVLEFRKQVHFELACQEAIKAPYEQVLNECLDYPRKLIFRLSGNAKPQDEPVESYEEIDVLQMAQILFAGEFVGKEKCAI